MLLKNAASRGRRRSLDIDSDNIYVVNMTHDEARRVLAKLGAEFIEKKKHTLVLLNGRLSFLPRHGRKEIPPGTWAAIRRQLDLKE